MKIPTISLSLLLIIITSALTVSGQDATAIVNQLDLAQKPMVKRTESLYRTVETPQINKLEAGYLLTYVDVNYNAHLIFLDSSMQVTKDVKLFKSGIVRAHTGDGEIALLRCKYVQQREGSAPYHFEHELFFERYNLDGKKTGSTRLVGDKYYFKGRKNRAYRPNYESALIKHDGKYYASFPFHFDRHKKYDRKFYRLVQIDENNDILVLNTQHNHVIQSKLIVHQDTLFHILTQTRGPRALLLKKYSIAEIETAERRTVEVKNTSKDIDIVSSIKSPQITLYAITDGVDKSAFLCSDDQVPIRIDHASVNHDGIKLVLTTMQDRTGYDIQLVSYSRAGTLLTEVPLANDKNTNETSPYVVMGPTSLFMAYTVSSKKNDIPDRSEVMQYNFESKKKTVLKLDANAGIKPVFKFFGHDRDDSWRSRLVQRDFCNERCNYTQLDTESGMLLLNWDADGISTHEIEATVKVGAVQ